VLDGWASSPGAADDIPLLRNSYEALPSRAHQRMFLDAALLLHDRPQLHLTTLWAAQLQQDEQHGGGRQVFRGMGWRSRGKRVHDDPRLQRSINNVEHCRLEAGKLLGELVKWSLLDLHDGSGSTADSLNGGAASKDTPSTVARCGSSGRTLNISC
jgi:hypothetical protein